MLTPDFERRLIDNIQPIRYFMLAQVLHHALELGLFELVGEAPGLPDEQIAGKLDLEPQRLLALLRYLQNEGYVVDDDGWSLTAKGAGLPEFAPWFEMLVGGYAPTMQQLGDVLRKGAPYATRDDTRVGVGSCGIGVYDALPLVEKLLDAADRPLDTIVDLGCGDGGFLTDLLLHRPELRGIGMDPNPALVHRGAARAATSAVASRADFHHGSASAVADLKLPDRGRGTGFMTAFILQEVLEQEGEAAVEELLRTTLDTYPEALWLVVEMDLQPTSPVMAHGLAKAFYNPYFLIHSITEQRLGTDDYWQRLFERVGLQVMHVDHPDSRADSTGLQFGYLLSRR